MHKTSAATSTAPPVNLVNNPTGSPRTGCNLALPEATRTLQAPNPRTCSTRTAPGALAVNASAQACGFTVGQATGARHLTSSGALHAQRGVNKTGFGLF